MVLKVTTDIWVMWSLKQQNLQSNTGELLGLEKKFLKHNDPLLQEMQGCQLVGVLVGVSIAAQKHYGPKASWGGKGLFSLHFHITVQY